MLKKIKRAHIVIMAILLLTGVLIGRKLTFEHHKKIIVQRLGEYKSEHAVYPQDLNEIDPAGSKIFYYSAGSDGQSFLLSYHSGIMNVNTNVYDSRTGQWTEK